MSLKFSNLCQALTHVGKGDLGRLGNDPEINRARFDSRRIQPGDLFCALPGCEDDGRQFMNDAIHNGAVAVLHAGGPGATVVPEFLVDLNTPVAHAAGLAASHLAGQPFEEMLVAAVTGTNGKSTVVHMIAEALQHASVPTARVGTLGFQFGIEEESCPNTTPSADLLQDWGSKVCTQGARVVAIEASSHGLIQHRLAGTSIDVAGWTNLTQDHLDYHPDMESYAVAKAQLFQRLGSGGCGFIPAANSAIAAACQGVKENLQRWGLDQEKAELSGNWQPLKEGGLTLEITGQWGEISITSSFFGRHNAENLLLSFGMLRACGLQVEEAATALSQVSGVPGRLERVAPESPWNLFVDYAHTPDALSRVLAALRGVYPAVRIGVVFGAGGDRDASKRKAMGRAVAGGSDWCVVTSDNPRGEDPQTIVDEVAAGASAVHRDVRTRTDRRAAVKEAIGRLRPGDVLLLAGKGHETYQEVDGVRHPFDDRVVLAEAARC